MTDNQQTGTEQEPSRYVTVFHQLKETEDGERGDRLVVHGEHLDDRYVMDDELEDFVPVARPIAVIDAGVEMEHDELGEWCNSHAGKAILNEFFPDIEPDDPTLRDVEEYLDDEPEVVADGGYPWNVRIDLGGVTFEGPGMGSEQEAQAIKEIVEGSEPVDGVQVIRQ